MSRGQKLLRRVTAAIALTLAVALLAACGGLGNIGGVGAGGNIIGEIRDADTKALITGIDVTVSVGILSTTTDNGHFELKGVPTGPQTIKATAEGYEDFSELYNVPAGPSSFNIEMTQASATVTGQVMVPPANAPGIAYTLPQFNLWQKALAFLKAPVAHASLTGEVGLPGATVIARNWTTGKDIAGPVTTDTNGNFTLTDIPRGTNILIEVTYSDVRLASVVPEVGDSEHVEVNTVSTFVAEGLSKNFGVERVDSDVYDELKFEIERWLASKDINEIDLRGGQGWIGTEFGSDDNLNQEFVQLRDEVVPAQSEIAVAKSTISTLRNLAPSLVAFGAPVVDKAVESINEKVGPALASVVDRLSIIADLVADADLGELNQGDDFTFEDDEENPTYALHVVLDEVDGDETKTVTSTFTLANVAEDEELGSGEMTFLKSEDRPVDWMDIDVSFFETVEEETIEINLAGLVEYTWADTLVGDLRDLKKITITHGEVDSTEGENLLTGFALLEAELDEYQDGDTIYVVISSLKLTDGAIQVEDITIDGDLTYTLAAGKDEYDLVANITILNDDLSDEDFKIYGQVKSNGVPLLGDEIETDTEFAATNIEFDGHIQVPNRRLVTIKFDGDRNAMYGFELSDLVFTDGKVQLTGGGTVKATQGEPGEKVLFETLDMELNLVNSTDDGDYTFDFSINITDGGENMTADGVLKSPAGQDLAYVKPKPITGANVEYLHDDWIEVHSLF